MRRTTHPRTGQTGQTGQTRPPIRKLATEELEQVQGGSGDDDESAACVLDNGSG